MIKDFNKFLEKRKLDLGNYLMEAFLAALDTGDIYSIGDNLERMIKQIDLPYQKCSRCQNKMSYFEFHLKQGLCDKCADELECEELEEERGK